MEFNKPVSNPLLMGAIEVLKAEQSTEHHNMVINEILKARFVAPAEVDPIPKTNENGETMMDPGTKIHFPVLTAPDGQNFLPAFTDLSEMEKWEKKGKLNYFALTFDDYAGMLFRKDANGNEYPGGGVVINPFGCNMVLTKEMFKNILEARAKARQAVHNKKRSKR